MQAATHSLGDVTYVISDAFRACLCAYTAPTQPRTCHQRAHRRDATARGDTPCPVVFRKYGRARPSKALKLSQMLRHAPRNVIPLAPMASSSLTTTPTFLKPPLPTLALALPTTTPPLPIPYSPISSRYLFSMLQTSIRYIYDMSFQRAEHSLLVHTAPHL